MPTSNKTVSTIWENLHLVAARKGNKAAIVSESGEALTFGELEEQIGYVVGRLNACGVSRNERVAIALLQSPELAVAFLGVASGATAAPLNPAYKKSDFLFYLQDLNARALIVKDGEASLARDAAQELGISVLELKGDTSKTGRFELLGNSATAEGDTGYAAAEDIGLVLHTSGTTSRPKMVPLSHLNLCASTKHIIETLQLSDEDACLNIMPLFHIHGLIACILASLCSGGKTICSPSFDAGSFFNILSKLKPSWYSAVPTMHQAILGDGDVNQNKNSSLRFIRSSSAALPPTIMSGLEALFGVPVIESYGMTEATHQMASNPLPPLERKPGSVGIAAGPEIAIFNDTGGRIEEGQTGEVCIRGINVTRGYENNPEANTGAFFADGWFRTGDQGYLDEEGYLFLTGRLKEMINRGGENIAPREIDEALLDHPDVNQAVGFAVPHESLGEDIAAAVILEAESKEDEASLHTFLIEKLADFKVPSRILILDAIPNGPTGKLQRIGLADKLADKLQITFEAPQTESENLVCSIIEEVLDRKPVGLADNFFYLGGDSLRAAQVINRINAKLSLSLPVVNLFHFPTCRQLAENLESVLKDQELDELAKAMEQLSEEERNQLLGEGPLSGDNQ